MPLSKKKRKEKSGKAKNIFLIFKNHVKETRFKKFKSAKNQKNKSLI